MIGYTDSTETNVDDKIYMGQKQIKAWMTNYSKNRWENQTIYPELFIEKKALIGVFEQPCLDMDIALCPCKGYPSLTYIHDAANRFKEARNDGKEPIILYFGDYDPSGEDIPRSIGETLYKMDIEVEVKRILLMEHQVIKWKLPPAPTKITDSRSANWSGLGQVELDAIEPRKLKEIAAKAIMELFDEDLYEDLKAQESDEEEIYVSELKQFVNTL